MVKPLPLSTYPNSWKGRRKRRRGGRKGGKEELGKKKGSERGSRLRSSLLYTEESLVLKDCDCYCPAISVPLCKLWSVPCFRCLLWVGARRALRLSVLENKITVNIRTISLLFSPQLVDSIGRKPGSRVSIAWRSVLLASVSTASEPSRTAWLWMNLGNS